MNIVVFSGAGLDKDSGIPTFTSDGEKSIYNDYDIMKMLTPKGLMENPGKLYSWIEDFRVRCDECEPNKAHLFFKELENEHSVTHITQNVSNLLEKAGCSRVYHLHGQLNKARHLNDHSASFEYDIEDGLLYPNSANLRHSVVLFEEMPLKIDESIESLIDCDILIIVGTSFNITYTIDLIANAKKAKKIIYVDPEIDYGINNVFSDVYAINKGIVESLEELKFVIDGII